MKKQEAGMVGKEADMEPKGGQSTAGAEQK